MALRSRTPFHQAVSSEWDNIAGESAAQVRASAALPQVPLVVLTAGQHGDRPPPGVSEADFARWNALLHEMQADLASRCSNSVHLTVSNSTHVIQLDQPGVVVEAIRQVVVAVKEHRPVSAASEWRIAAISASRAAKVYAAERSRME